MKVNLVLPGAELSPEAVRPATEPLPANQRDLARDLDLTTIWAAMAAGTPHLWEVARSLTLYLLAEPLGVAHRREVLQDLRAHPEAAQQLYEIASGAMAADRRMHDMLHRTPASTLRRGIEALRTLLGDLKRLRRFAEIYDGKMTSEGMGTLLATLIAELDDQYFAEMSEELSVLRLENGFSTSARLGKGNKGTGYVLRMPTDSQSRRKRGAGRGTARSSSFEVHPRDESGRQALARLEDRALDSVANALAQSADHVLALFTQLRTEVAYYLGCLHLEQRLEACGAPLCRPEPVSSGLAPVLSAAGLYDPALVLRTGSPAVVNDLEADGRKLVMITGANSGGKTTLLRAIGLGQLMMQCGMDVCATAYRSTVCAGLFTHFAREEDRSMEHGRFDEELSRMRAIAERLTPGTMVLFNESFAGTAESEGSVIAREVVRALVGSGVRVVFVTHLYDLAASLFTDSPAPALFLRAERRDDGERTFKVLEGPPLPTSYGTDLYERIGGFEPVRSAGS